MDLTKEELLHAYLQMERIRRFEEEVHQIFLQGDLHGTTHLYIGQEACAVGACTALEPEDLITSTHRGHGHAIAKGGNLSEMMAEILGKETGTCKGRGGSMHIGHIDQGNLGANAVVGGGHSIAVGAALAQQMKGEEGITLCFFGDGATNEGSFHESLNMASVWKLPVIFFCENNYYGLSTPTSKAMNIHQIARRGESYGIPGVTVDGNDFQQVYLAVKEARAFVKQEGPLLLVANTYRHMGHSKSDDNAYRPAQEVLRWKKRDPLVRMAQLLKEQEITQEELISLEHQATREVAEAVSFAKNSPDPSADELTRGVYA